MKKVLKAVKLTGISVTASFAVLGAIYFFETKPVSADANEYKVVVEDYSQPSTNIVVETPSVVATVDTVDKADEVEAIDKAGPIEEAVKDDEAAIEDDTEAVTEETESATEETEAETESVEEATEAPTEAATPAPTQPATEAPTVAAPAPTEAATQAPTPAPAPAPAPAPVEAATQAPTVATPAPAPAPAAPAQTVASTLTSVSYNGNTYSTIEEAKASINVATLTDAEAHAQAVANKTTYAAEAQALIDQINAYRASNGLPALAYNDNLATAAMHRAAESAYSDWNMTAMENGAKRHIRPNFQKASTIADYYGISGNFGENYARYYVTPEETLEGWQNSSAHNSLLLSSDYSQIGIGIAPAPGGYGDFYWIAIFN